MIVCICHRVSDRDIARAVRAGCDSFEALQDDLRVATACGACHDCASATFREHTLPAGARVGVLGGVLAGVRAGVLAGVLADISGPAAPGQAAVQHAVPMPMPMRMPTPLRRHAAVAHVTA